MKKKNKQSAILKLGLMFATNKRKTFTLSRKFVKEIIEEAANMAQNTPVDTEYSGYSGLLDVFTDSRNNI